MPMKSQKQRAWMWANEPEMAKRWEKHTPKGDLPVKAKKECSTPKMNEVFQVKEAGAPTRITSTKPTSQGTFNKAADGMKKVGGGLSGVGAQPVIATASTGGAQRQVAGYKTRDGSVWGIDLPAGGIAKQITGPGNKPMGADHDEMDKLNATVAGQTKPAGSAI